MTSNEKGFGDWIEARRIIDKIVRDSDEDIILQFDGKYYYMELGYMFLPSKIILELCRNLSLLNLKLYLDVIGKDKNIRLIIYEQDGVINERYK